MESYITTLLCPYCHRLVRSCEGGREAMRVHRIDPSSTDRCPASGLTVDEARHTRPAEQIIEEVLTDA